MVGTIPSTNGRGGHALTAGPLVCVKPEADEKPSEPPEAPDDPHRLARLYLAAGGTESAGRTLVRWNSQYYRWASGAYNRVPDHTVRDDLTAFVRKQFERDYAEWTGEEKKRPPTVRPVRQALVSDVLGALHGMVAVPFGLNPPGWLDGTPAAADIVNTPTGIVNLPALADGRRDAVTAPTPRFFTTTKTGVGYDPKAPRRSRG